MSIIKKSKAKPGPDGHRPPQLTPQQVEQINRLLASLGEYGEIHLIVQKGELRFINKVDSQRAWRDEEV